MDSTPLAEVADRCAGVRIEPPEASEENVKVLGVCHDSRTAAKGDLFACIGGASHDGHAYAPEAVSRGAVALLVERQLDVDVPQLIVPDVRKAVGHAASAVYGYPSAKLKVVGVTGTAGKTTVVHALAETLKAIGVPAGVLGTLEGSHTTPEAPDFQKALSSMQKRGDDWACVEVSSHGLEYGRVNGTDFAAAVFTNLSAEHLDFHQDMEAYFLAKRRLFEQTNGVLIVAVVDQWGERLANELRESGRQELIVVEPKMVENPVSDVRVSSFAWRGHKVHTPLLGSFNMFNLVIVGEVLVGLGLEADVVARGLEEVTPIKGRMELVPVRGSDVSVIVDYSHKPGALSLALETVRSLSSGRVWVVFGAGGNRDKAKRPLMGKVASDLADEIIVTSDNPRYENPSEIAEQIVEGVDEAGVRPRVLLDRAEAINFAVRHAEHGDSILIAGKGHETYQLIEGERKSFDDVKVAEEALLARARRALP